MSPTDVRADINVSVGCKYMTTLLHMCETECETATVYVRLRLKIENVMHIAGRHDGYSDHSNQAVCSTVELSIGWRAFIRVGHRWSRSPRSRTARLALYIGGILITLPLVRPIVMQSNARMMSASNTSAAKKALDLISRLTLGCFSILIVVWNKLLLIRFQVTMSVAHFVTVRFSN